MTQRVAEYERLLRDILGRVSHADAELIRNSLLKAPKAKANSAEETQTSDDTAADDVRSNIPSDTVIDTPPAVVENTAIIMGSECEISARASSLSALSHTDEDFTREQARCTGFHGQMSELTWLRRLRIENTYGD
jgi:hypothetical protein